MSLTIGSILLAASLNAAVIGDSHQNFVTGLAAFSEGNYPQSFVTWKKLANRGDARAQYSMAVMYELGRGVLHDYSEAARWYEQSATQGYAMARNNLGMLYESGLGVPQDYAIAFDYYRQAAEQGLPSAQYNLALMYYEGLGSARNFEESARWLAVSAKQGFSSAQYNLGVMYENGYGVSQDYAEAAKWYIEAIKWGATQAQATLKDLLEDKAVEVVTSGEGIVIRGQPNDSAERLAKVAGGTTVYTLKTDGVWSAVLLSDRKTIGWIEQRHLR